MRKKDLIKRIEILERQVSNIKNPSLLTEAERRAEENELKSKVYDWTNFLRETVSIQGMVLGKYREVLITSGLITPCDASRTEFQWQEGPDDKLGRNFHFKVNKVQIKGEE